MALKMNFTQNLSGATQQVITKDAYWRVMDIAGNKNELLVKMEIRESANAPAAIGLFPFSFVPSNEGGNYTLQAYEHLRTLPQFVGAIDC